MALIIAPTYTPNEWGLVITNDLNGTSQADQIVGSTYGEYIYGHGGFDEIYANDGNDAISGGIDGIADYIDGGDGFDIIDYRDATRDMTIDLQAGYGQADAFFGTAITPWGGTFHYFLPAVLEDTFTSIEGVWGGSGNDTIIGTNKVNNLYGNDGNDEIYGFGGDDYLNGGLGNDIIDSGAGSDAMEGGGGSDTFVFSTQPASWATKFGGDVKPFDLILDFARGPEWADGDTIDLSAIDANVYSRVNQAFQIVDHFTGQPGQLTLNQDMIDEIPGWAGPSQPTWQVWQGDVDGNGVADFSIGVNVTGLIGGTLNETDFLL